VAESMNIRRRSAPVPTLDAAKKAELEARATGRQQVPKPASPLPPGVTGNPPLPVGKPVGREIGPVDPSSLTDAERDAIIAAGWDADVPLPSTPDGLKRLQQLIEDANSAEVPLEIGNRPPLQVETVDINKLPETKRKEFLAKLEGITHQEVTQAAASRASAGKQTNFEGGVQARGVTGDAIRAFKEKAAAQIATEKGQPAPSEEAIPVGVPGVSGSRDPVGAPGNAVASETGADAKFAICPHCGWDQARPSIAEPSQADKMAFLHCLLGEKPFVKEYKLYGGAVTVVFRTLAPRELEVIYKQAYRDRQQGKLPEEVDYYERLNRYRLLLQVASFSGTGAGGFHRDLPDGYSPATNPQAAKVWLSADEEKEIGLEETGLPDVEKYMVDNVLRSEQVFVAVNSACNQFNRLVAKMEANAENSDFWSATGEPS